VSNVKDKNGVSLILEKQLGQIAFSIGGLGFSQASDLKSLQKFSIYGLNSNNKIVQPQVLYNPNISISEESFTILNHSDGYIGVVFREPVSKIEIIPLSSLDIDSALHSFTISSITTIRESNKHEYNCQNKGILFLIDNSSSMRDINNQSFFNALAKLCRDKIDWIEYHSYVELSWFNHLGIQYTQKFFTSKALEVFLTDENAQKKSPPPSGNTDYFSAFQYAKTTHSALNILVSDGMINLFNGNKSAVTEILSKQFLEYGILGIYNTQTKSTLNFPEGLWEAEFNELEKWISSNECNLSESNENIKIIPNPSSGYFNIYCPNGIPEHLLLNLIDESGKIVKCNFNIELDKITVDASILPSGIYILLWSDGQQTLRKRIVILHS
jgi:Secretion system C-terminal sorting domain